MSYSLTARVVMSCYIFEIAIFYQVSFPPKHFCHLRKCISIYDCLYIYEYNSYLPIVLIHVNVLISIFTSINLPELLKNSTRHSQCLSGNRYFESNMQNLCRSNLAVTHSALGRVYCINKSRACSVTHLSDSRKMC